MRIPWPFGARQTAAKVEEARLPNVVHGSVVVDPDVGTTFTSNLPPDEFARGSVQLICWVEDAERHWFGQLPSEAFLGVLVQRDAVRGDLFVANDRFFEFLQYAMAEIGPTLPEVQHAAQAARRAGGRNLFIYDARNDDWLKANPLAMPPDSEAIGVFLVGDGRITAQSYLRNTNYNRWSALGPTKIPVAFRAGLVERLVALDATGRGKPQ